MNKFLSPGVIAGILTASAAIANMAGKPALGAFLSDPATATNATNVLIAGGAIVSGALQGWHGPAKA